LFIFSAFPILKKRKKRQKRPKDMCNKRKEKERKKHVYLKKRKKREKRPTKTYVIREKKREREKNMCNKGLLETSHRSYHRPLVVSDSVCGASARKSKTFRDRADHKSSWCSLWSVAGLFLCGQRLFMPCGPILLFLFFNLIFLSLCV